MDFTVKASVLKQRLKIVVRFHVTEELLSSALVMPSPAAYQTSGVTLLTALQQEAAETEGC